MKLKMVQNSLLQITLWGGPEEGNFLHEYALKIWSGLISNFYYKRWSLYLENLESNLASYDVSKDRNFQSKLIAFEWEFVHNSSNYVTISNSIPNSIDDPVKFSNQLYVKWIHLSGN